MSTTPTPTPPAKSGSYDPHAIETPVYEFWEKGGYFRSVPDKNRQPFTIVIPPPNVTGSLHLGHALNNTLQDALIRRKRMQGFNACWLPGTDHAGIATQAVVERKLKEEENKSRHEVGREGLVQRIWDWKKQYGDRIIEQLRRMGCSCDWDRTRFTLDDMCAKAVYETFFRLFRDGLIYRGLRLVNWDAALQTAVADDEIVYQKVKGHLWQIRYPIDGTNEHLIVATTRPETMLGDTALAVHPDDPRYKHLIGKHVLLPPLLQRKIPIIADGLLVNPEFGTGVVKVTPGHDPNDYACGQRNDLPQINILTVDGRIRDDADGKQLFGKYAGLERYAARKQIVADLEAAGLLEKAEPYEHEVGHSDRSKTPIEPMLSEQWFVKMANLAEAAMEAVRDGRVQFFPQRYAKTYLDWLGEKRDWCISRQLWWGHRIPVWTFRSGQRFGPGGPLEKLKQWIRDGLVAVQWIAQSSDRRTLEAAIGRKAAQEALLDYSSEADAQIIQMGFCSKVEFLEEFERFANEHQLKRGDDVLDTWFSSALWPFSTFGWPDAANSDLNYYYPTSVLSTARDIISLWVARMVMMGLYNTSSDGAAHRGRVPFSHVFIHPVIQDGQGRRMSKSLGNGVDPLDLIEMYGADAMRFTLASMAGETQDIRIPVKPVKTADGRQINTSERFELGRNFCNKLWQASTGFVIANLTATGAPADAKNPQPNLKTRDPALLALEDRWILSRLQHCIAEVDRRLDEYEFSAATSALYSFFWSDFCDWYVELVKPRLYKTEGGDNRAPATGDSADAARQVLAYVLDQSLRLLHPFIPYVTETLWKELGAAAPFRGIAQLEAAGPALIAESWPRVDESLIATDVDERMARLQDAIRALRDVKARVNGIRAQARETVIRTLPRGVLRADASLVPEFAAARDVLCRLGQCDALDIGDNVPRPPDAASKVFKGFEVYVSLTGLANLDLERQRLRKEIDETRSHADRTAAKLANEGFVASAPPAVVEKERTRLAELREKLAALEENLAQISA
jgi:valyl-tRNA synthetase